jgi:hypothetical protein
MEKKNKVQFKLEIINRGKNNHEKKRFIKDMLNKQQERRREIRKAPISRVMAT